MNDFLPAKFEASASPAPLQPVYPVESSGTRAAPAAGAQRFLAYLRLYWWVLLLTSGLCLGIVGGYLLWAPPTFVSTARMWETEKMRLPEQGAFTVDLQNYLGTQVELLQSDKLRSLALARLRNQGTNSIPLDSRGRPVPVRLRVTQVPKTAVLEAQAYTSHPGYAQAYLNAALQEYLEYKKAVRKTVSGDTVASISEQALRLEKELKGAQDALTEFQRTNNLAILEEEARVAGGYLARLKTQQSDIELESELLEATALGPGGPRQANTNGVDSLLGMVPAGGSTPSAAALERQAAWKEVEVLKIQREKLSKYLRPEHPKIVKLDADIERGQKLIEIYQRQSRDELGAARHSLTLKSNSVQASITEWEAKVVAANQQIAAAERLKLNVNRTQSLYDRLVLVLQNLDISRNVDRETLAVFEPASVAVRSRGRELLLLPMALMAGLFSGGCLVFLVQAHDDRFSSALEVDERFGDSIVGQVPEVPWSTQDGSIPLIGLNGQGDLYAEAYRNLRSALLFLPVEGIRPKLLLITSALPGEGKSTIAANLARALALGGSRVLLVDGDLRKGQLHKLMGQACEPGLAEAIEQPQSAHRSIHPDSVPNLVFIPRGSTRHNPGDLLLQPQLEQLFSRWRQQFDYVLIDSCPVFAADDVTTLAHKVDGTLFVLRRRFSRGALVREALELLLHRQAKVLGLVFNRADSSAHSYHYYKYEGYQNGGAKGA